MERVGRRKEFPATEMTGQVEDWFPECEGCFEVIQSAVRIVFNQGRYVVFREQRQPAYLKQIQSRDPEAAQGDPIPIPWGKLWECDAQIDSGDASMPGVKAEGKRSQDGQYVPAHPAG